MGLGNITKPKWYKSMMPKLYGWGATLVILVNYLRLNIRQGSFNNADYWIIDRGNNFLFLSF